MIASVAAATCVLASACAGAGTARPLVSLVASPARLVFAGSARQTVQVTNTGRAAAVVDVSRAGLALDLRGRPRVVPARADARTAARWISIRPRRFRIAPGGVVTLAVASHPPRGAEPGDHEALALLTTRPPVGGSLAVRLRMGVVVAVRVPGRVVHRLRPGGVRVLRSGRVRVLALAFANRGNVTERLLPRCLAVSLRRDGRTLARLRPAARDLLPRSRGILELRYRGPVRGPAVVRVEVPPRAPCVRFPRRAFRVRL